MADERRYYVYLLTNWNNRVMYVGVANDLTRRVHEHKNKLVNGFPEKYNINKLVYFEETGDVAAALAREKEIKRWRREEKEQIGAEGEPGVERFERNRMRERFLPLVEMTAALGDRESEASHAIYNCNSRIPTAPLPTDS